MKSQVFCLMGPTASGKTDLVLEAAAFLPIDIISVDSAMVYCGMDIGTAKPDKEIQTRYPHFLIDICDPSESYSVGDFYRDVMLQIEKSIAGNRIPVLVGGTMMYFHALMRGLSQLPTVDQEMRQRLCQEGEEKGWPYLHQQLIEVDPESGARIHAHDKQRISRALEVFYLTGKTISAFQKENSLQSPYQFKWLALFPTDRSNLHHKIALRFDEMLTKGFLDEVQQLFARGDLHIGLPAIRSVNYRQAWEYLAGKITINEMKLKAVAATRQLAKRQLTWLRSFNNLCILNGEVKELLHILEK